MAEETTTSTRSRFLNKVKWRGKTSSTGEVLTADPKGRSSLNDDVADFLRPSIDKSQPPRIDVAIAQRWPAAPQVISNANRITDAQPPAAHARANGRPRKKKNLTVGFVKAAPEIIGEGGDEADTPAIEVSRMRAKLARSLSHNRHSGPRGTGAGFERDSPQKSPQKTSNEEYFQPRPLQRAQTSYGELGPLSQGDTAFQQRNDSPRQYQGTPARPGHMKRAPTGFGLNGSEHQQESPHAEDDFISRSMQRTSTGWDGRQDAVKPGIDHSEYDSPPDTRSSNSGFSATSPTSIDSHAASIQHRTRAEEGNALHRNAEQPRESFGDNSKTNSVDPYQASNAMPPPRPSQNVPIRSVPLMHFHDEHRPASSDSAHRKGSPVRGNQARTSRDYEQSRQPTLTATSNNSPTRPRPGMVTHASTEDRPSSRSEARRPLSIPQPYDKYSGSTAASARPRSSTTTSQSDKLPSPRYAVQLPTPPIFQSAQSRVESSPATPNPQAPLLPHSLIDPNHGFLGRNPTRPTPSPQVSQRDASGYFSRPLSGHGAPAKSPATNMLQHDSSMPSSRPSSSHGMPVLTPNSDGAAAADAALSDFGARVAHMRGVFRLTAERERASVPTPSQWLRASVWWFLKGRAGLEVLMKGRPRSGDGQQRERLTQAHVDLAKAWWITCDVLSDHADSSPNTERGSAGVDEIREEVPVTIANLKALLLSMTRNNVMPPYQSLIQGQDTTIWVKYPNFAPDVAMVLAGSVKRSLIADAPKQQVRTLEVMPLADSRSDFCYGRMFVNVSINTEEEDTDRVVLPCVLSITRSRSDWQAKISICSQDELVNTCVYPANSSAAKKGPTWNDVQWREKARGLYIRLPRGFTLSAEFEEKDYLQLSSIYEYTRKVEASLRPLENERLVHEAALLELQYQDSSKPQTFPGDKVRGCVALVFERRTTTHEGGSMNHLHRGYRLLLVTNPSNKTLSCASHDVGSRSPLLFEFVTEAAANGPTAMVIRTRDGARQCRMLLVFKDANERQAMYDTVNGITVSPDEAVAARFRISELLIESASQAEGFCKPGQDALRKLSWQSLTVINDDP
ncbi:hypothetical protein LTR66_009376, partial [Elasticomyces elasticus]